MGALCEVIRKQRPALDVLESKGVRPHMDKGGGCVAKGQQFLDG